MKDILIKKRKNNNNDKKTLTQNRNKLNVF